MENTISILLAVKSDSALFDLQNIILNAGYNILGTVNSEEDLVALMDETNPDLIIIDNTLENNINNIGLSEKIKSIKNIPIIFIADSNNKENYDTSIGIKPYACLAKPYTDKDIISIIESTLYKHELDIKLKNKNSLSYAFFNQDIIAIVVFDPQDNKLLEINDVALKYLGYTREELSKLNLYDIDINFNYHEYKSQIKEALENGTLSFEKLYKTKTGQIRNIIVNNTTLIIRNKTLIFSVWLDVTETKKINQELVESEEKYRFIIENAIDLIYKLDINKKFTFINSNALKKLEYTLDEIFNITYMDIISSEYISSEFNFLQNQIKENIEVTYRELPMVSKYGKIIWVGQNIRLTKKDDRIELDCIARDITELKNSQNALKTSEEKYRTILETIDEGYYETDLKGNYTFVNNALPKILGIKKDEIIGENYKKVLGEQLAKSVLQAFKDVFKTKRKATPAWELTTKDNIKKYLESSIDIARDSIGQETGFRGMIRDITEKKQAQDELNEYKNNLEKLVEQRTEELTKAKDMAEKANKTKSDFIATMSHELRTPLNSVIGFAKLMQMGYKPDDYNANLENIISSAEHLLKLINDILDLAKIEAGKMKFDMKPLLINNIILSCLKIVASVTSSKNITISYSIQDESIKIFGVEKWLKQIFLNLLSNAIKYTNKDGNIQINVKEIKGTCYIDVIDSGIGIEEKFIDEIFNKFSQIKDDANIDNNIEGTGLGLTITRKLIEAHGGMIKVESEKGKGSVFTVMLPCIRHIKLEQKSEKKENKMIQNIESNKYIIVADDMKTNRELLNSYFKITRRNYLNAETGEECINLIESRDDIGLILMDVKMKGMSGIDAMKSIKSKCNIPVIAVTAFAMEGTKDELLNLGFDNYISKPIDFDVLSEMISQYLK